MACGAEVYMEEDYSEQNIYFIINHGELDWIFFAFPWQLHARVLQKCYSSLSKKKKKPTKQQILWTHEAKSNAARCFLQLHEISYSLNFCLFSNIILVVYWSLYFKKGLRA